MRWFDDLKLRSKLVVTLMAVFATESVVGTVGMLALYRITEDARDLGESKIPGVVAASTLETELNAAERELRAGLAGNGSEWTAELDQHLERVAHGLTVARDAHAESGEEKALVERISALFGEWRPAAQTVATLAREGKRDEAAKAFLGAKLPDTERALEAAAAALSRHAREEAEEVVKDANHTASLATWGVLGAIAFVMLFGFGLVWRVAGMLAAPLVQVADRAERLRAHCITGLGAGMEAMSHGDLAVEVAATTQLLELERADEIGDMAGTIDGAIRQTQATIAAYNASKRTVGALAAEAAMLAEAAREGRLSTRGDAGRFEGKFRELVQGVNDTLEAAIAPVNEAAEVLDRVAERDFTHEVVGSYRGDHARIKLALNTAVAEVRRALATIGQSADTLAASSEALTSVATRIGTGAEQTSSQAGVVSAAAEQVSKNVETVATGTEEMTASIKEIAKNAAEANRVAVEAVHVAESANSTVGKLGASSAEIGEVLKLITSIAQQTNLLALNATIEAARAGEAGKGFAVVANEVKELAKETAKATENIGRKIEAIQSDSTGAVQAIGQISQIIAQINDLQSTIAVAVEEQTATTNEISRNVSEAARGSSEIAHNITGVAQAATDTTGGAQEGMSSAQDLAHMAGELRALLGQFRYDDTHTDHGRTGRAAAPAPIARANAAPRPHAVR